MIGVFETDVHSLTEAKLILGRLSSRYPGCRINFDLEDCDNILRVEGEGFGMDDIISVLEELGYYCKELPY